MSSSKIFYLNKNDYFNNQLNNGYNNSSNGANANSYMNLSMNMNTPANIHTLMSSINNPSHLNSFNFSTASAGHLGSNASGKLIQSKNYFYVPSTSSIQECEKGNLLHIFIFFPLLQFNSSQFAN